MTSCLPQPPGEVSQECESEYENHNHGKEEAVALFFWFCRCGVMFLILVVGRCCCFVLTAVTDNIQLPWGEGIFFCDLACAFIVVLCACYQLWMISTY